MVSGEPGVSDVYGMAVNGGVPEMKVILICPKCKRRVMYDYDEWVKSCLPMAKARERIRCSNDDLVMLYHKDVVE
jgi:hypothetical protein